MFHPLDHFCGPSLDALQQLHVSPALRTPHLYAVLQMRPHQRRAEGQDHLPWAAGHTSSNADSGYSWFSRLWGHIAGSCSASHPPTSPGLLQQSCTQFFISQLVFVVDVALIQVQHFAFGFVETHEVHLGPLLRWGEGSKFRLSRKILRNLVEKIYFCMDSNIYIHT